MLESGLSGSVRGVPSNGHPYRDPRPLPDIGRPSTDLPAADAAVAASVWRRNLGKSLDEIPHTEQDDHGRNQDHQGYIGNARCHIGGQRRS
jgi:hypothetical protein